MSLERVLNLVGHQRISNAKILSVLVLVSLFFTTYATPSAVYAVGTIRHVTPTGLNSGTCSTWASACNLQRALSVVAVSGDQVWVKHGTYKPGSARGDTFNLRSGIKIYGGFVGTETKLSQRNPATHVTILSGEIGAVGTTDNSYHVVTAGGVTNSALLDGFTITVGNADGSIPDDRGGGMIVNSASPMVNNIIFIGNQASSGAGGMYVNMGSPSLTNVTFQGNSAYYGGGLFNFLSSPTLTNITFHGNSAFYSGGGIYNSDSSPSLTNVTFHGNSVTNGYGAGMYNYSGSDPILTNVTFYGNSTFLVGGGIYNDESSPIIYDSIFWNNGSEIFNSLSSSTIADSLIAGGCPSGATCTGKVLTSNPLLGALANNGGFTTTMSLGAGSPAIDAGNNSTCALTDQRGVHRPQGPDCDMGAYEAPVTRTFRSIGSQDGWVLESGENTNVGGGTPKSNEPILTLGDDAGRRQYRAVLSFNTSAVPDYATIISVKLKLKRSSVTPSATNPISLLHGMMVDMKKGFFGSSSALQAGDFQAAATQTEGPYSPTLSSGFYTITLNRSMFASVNKMAINGGLTQIRLRFKLDDNNNAIANTLNLVSGNNASASNRPTLIIVYTTPIIY